jgi:hypothetical protein
MAPLPVLSTRARPRRTGNLHKHSAAPLTPPTLNLTLSQSVFLQMRKMRARNADGGGVRRFATTSPFGRFFKANIQFFIRENIIRFSGLVRHFLPLFVYFLSCHSQTYIVILVQTEMIYGRTSIMKRLPWFF